ncbi:MAG: hypothetical protein EPN86_03960 [Nanoarchaeota archaeon]|nr:MAG: hypothetical protein EPN86_03960 [Nanoarchaeota archaeon]
MRHSSSIPKLVLIETEKILESLEGAIDEAVAVVPDTNIYSPPLHFEKTTNGCQPTAQESVLAIMAREADSNDYRFNPRPIVRAYSEYLRGLIELLSSPKVITTDAVLVELQAKASYFLSFEHIQKRRSHFSVHLGTAQRSVASMIRCWGAAINQYVSRQNPYPTGKKDGDSSIRKAVSDMSAGQSILVLSNDWRLSRSYAPGTDVRQIGLDYQNNSVKQLHPVIS